MALSSVDGSLISKVSRCEVAGKRLVLNGFMKKDTQSFRCRYLCASFEAAADKVSYLRMQSRMASSGCGEEKGLGVSCVFRRATDAEEKGLEVLPIFERQKM